MVDRRGSMGLHPAHLNKKLARPAGCRRKKKNAPKNGKDYQGQHQALSGEGRPANYGIATSGQSHHRTTFPITIEGRQQTKKKIPERSETAMQVGVPGSGFGPQANRTGFSAG